MDTMSYIIGRNSAGGGGEVTSLPWSKVTSKPFNTVDTTTGLTIVDGTLMLETLDHVATIDYVDDAIEALDIPDEVSVSQTLQSGTAIADITIGDTTTTLYAPAGGSGGSVDWADIANKPSINAGTVAYSISEGANTMASGNYGAHAEGYQTKASGWSSHAEGQVTRATGNSQHTQGKFNIEDTNNFYADIVGNGTSSYSYSNAEATDWSGNKYLAGNIYTNVIDWFNPQSGSVKLANIPAMNGTNYVDPDGLIQQAQDLIDNQSTDEWGNTEYTGEIDKRYQIQYLDGTPASTFDPSADSGTLLTGYYWVCVTANPIGNPMYGVDPDAPEEP